MEIKTRFEDALIGSMIALVIVWAFTLSMADNPHGKGFVPPPLPTTVMDDGSCAACIVGTADGEYVIDDELEEGAEVMARAD